MLVLTRCPGPGTKATICIGHDVKVTVLRIDGDQVEVAVTAPETLPIAYGPEAPACFPRVDKPRRPPVYWPHYEYRRDHSITASPRTCSGKCVRDTLCVTLVF